MDLPWIPRMKMLMRVLGWPELRLAQNLGFAKENAVRRLLKGGRPSIDTLLRLKALENLYAPEIAAGKFKKKSKLFPPDSIKCESRWWIGGIERKSASRPADLAAVGTNRADAAIDHPRSQPRNFPGRTLKTVDFTTEGRSRWAQYLREQPRRPKNRVVDFRSTVETANGGETKT